MTRRPPALADDLISQIDRVSRSIAECIKLGKDALQHRNDPDRIPFGLRNTATTYSDQIRVRLPDPATLGQIRSDPTLREELGFQHASFTLPPNRTFATEHRRIFVVSDDSDTRENETDEERAQQLHRNEVRADMRRNDEAIDWANRDLENPERRNPRNRRSPIQPRNLDADFVLNYNGQDVFATPSANLAAVYQVLEGLQETPEIVKARARLHVAATQAQQLRDDNSA